VCVRTNTSENKYSSKDLFLARDIALLLSVPVPSLSVPSRVTESAS
jgi:hypothetical protein